MASISAGVDELEFFVKFDTVKEFMRQESEVFLIQNQPYRVEMKKIIQRDAEYLGIFLNSHVDNKIKNWATFIEYTIKLVSFKTSIKSRYFRHKALFCSDQNSWGKYQFIAWEQLLNPKNGFVKDGTCVILITIKGTAMQNTVRSDLFTLKTIEKCCESRSKFQIEIKEFDNYLFGICSPVFRLKNLIWRIAIYESDDGCLRLDLYNISCYLSPQISCKATLKMALDSFKSNIAPIRWKGNFEFNRTSSTHGCAITKWNNFVNNNVFTFQFTIEIEEVNGIVKRKTKSNDDDEHKLKMSCTICFENLLDRPVSSLPCGHIFCTKCIVTALRYKSVCPCCKQKVQIRHVRPVLLQPVLH